MNRLLGLIACLVLAVPASVAAESRSLGDLFEEVDPAVVEIAPIQEVISDEGPAKKTRAGGLGSGFLISADGLIMTASHVVQMAEDVAVRWVTGDVSQAVVVSSNPNADVAIIRAEPVPDSITPLTLADSDGDSDDIIDTDTSTGTDGDSDADGDGDGDEPGRTDF